MADVLSSGPGVERPPRPPRRRRTTLVAGALVAAGVAYLAVQTGGRPGPERPPLSVELRPAPDPAATAFPARPATFRLDGDPGPGPSGPKLLVGGLEPAELDTGAGRLSRLPVPVATGDVSEFRRAGGTTTALLRNSARLRPRGVVLGPGERVTQLGAVLDLLPLRDGSVLTEDCTGVTGIGTCTLTDRAATGAVRWRRTVPGRLELVRDTPYGLLVRTYQGDPAGVLRLEDARTGRPARVIGRALVVLGADDRRVAFRPDGCGSECALTLADLATGASRFLPDEPGNAVVVALSADGRQVAIGYAGALPTDPDAGPQGDGYVVVVDLPADESRAVPDLSTGPGSTALPVWLRDGRLLLAVPTDGHGSGRVAVWTPGAPRLTLLPVGLTGFYGSPGQALLVT